MRDKVLWLKRDKIILLPTVSSSERQHNSCTPHPAPAPWWANLHAVIIDKVPWLTLPFPLLTASSMVGTAQHTMAASAPGKAARQETTTRFEEEGKT